MAGFSISGLAEKESERGSIKKVINQSRKSNPGAHLHCVVVERRVNVCIVLTASGAEQMLLSVDCNYNRKIAAE